MKITVLNQKYKCGCRKGLSKLDEPGILENLNKLVNWGESTIPVIKNSDESETEIRDFLGYPPSLKPGNCFLQDGQVIAIDSPDTLVLVVTETGPQALQRLYEEVWMPELELKTMDTSGDKITYSKQDEIPEEFKEFSVRLPYRYWKCLKDNNCYNPDEVLKCTADLDFLFSPTEIYISQYEIYGDPDLEDHRTLEYIGFHVLGNMMQGK